MTLLPTSCFKPFWRLCDWKLGKQQVEKHNTNYQFYDNRMKLLTHKRSYVLIKAIETLFVMILGRRDIDFILISLSPHSEFHKYHIRYPSTNLDSLISIKFNVGISETFPFISCIVMLYVCCVNITYCRTIQVGLVILMTEE